MSFTDEQLAVYTSITCLQDKRTVRLGSIESRSTRRCCSGPTSSAPTFGAVLQIIKDQIGKRPIYSRVPWAVTPTSSG